MASIFDFTTTQLIFMLLGVFLMGCAKAGLKGLDMINILLMAMVFGSKSSTGIVLPLLCVADVFAVTYYKRDVQWPLVIKLLPYIFIGILAGVYLGKEMDEVLFRKIMAIIVLITVAILGYTEVLKKEIKNIDAGFSGFVGIVVGFTTMIGNLAGAFANIYFLSLKISKRDFIGTAAWLFLIVNLSKLPFQIFYWHNINQSTLIIDLFLIPMLIIGFFVGLKLTDKINEKNFRLMVIAFTLLGALIMLLK